MVQVRWLDDSRGGVVGLTPMLAFIADVSFSRPVACLARNAQFRHMGIELLLFRVGHWPGTGRMAPDADGVPLLRSWLKVRVANERIIAQDPFLFRDQRRPSSLRAASLTASAVSSQ